MSIVGRAVRGAEAGALAAAGVALSFFVLDLIRFEPFSTPAVLSGAVFGPGGFQWFEWGDPSWSGLVAAVATTFRIATFTFVHFLSFAVVGVLASLLFDWKQAVILKPLLVVTALSAVAFSATVAGSSSVVALRSLGPVTVGVVSLFAALLVVGFLRLASMPEPEEASAS
jgi:hypothetical protein